jgi:hypothetical protein
VELDKLSFSLSIIRMVKSRKLRWTGHVAGMRKRDAYRLLVGKKETSRKNKAQVS